MLGLFVFQFYSSSLFHSRSIEAEGLNNRNEYYLVRPRDPEAFQRYLSTFFTLDRLESGSNHHPVSLKRHQKFLNKGDPREFIG